MRLIPLGAFLALPLVLTTVGQATANPLESRGFGCAGFCLGLFPNIHQHGPLFNYGPYYGYYPFTPYGPWDQYLRYDPFFYGDPYANWRAAQPGDCCKHGKCHKHLFGHKHSCKDSGFSHASWVDGGWFHGHTCLNGNDHNCKPACSTCGGVSVVTPVEQRNALARYAGKGNPAQSVVFYPATPTLNPTLEVGQSTAQVK